ncbi:MAG TPA: serine/threonine-protein kinase, partial [Polyangiaceae bacterium]
MSDDPDERAQERVGTVLNDKWTLERLVGIGGMAAVYAGLHRNGARAAIKVLHPSYARRAEIRERFLREGYAANRVNHSGVVKVLDDDIIEGGPDGGGAFLVMELLEGQSVEDRMEKGPPIGEREVLAIMRAVLEVLDVAHKAGVVHRDLKPENLFLARDPEKPEAKPRIKILDFGLARIAEGSNKTMAGVAIGTPSYMPPEQAAGRVFEVDHRSDLFALGATCFRILANRTVHPADGALAICARMAKEPAPKLRTVAPNVSQETANVIDKALEFKRENRWQDAAAMRDAAKDAIDALGGQTVEIDSGMIEVAERQESRSAPASPKPPPSLRHDETTAPPAAVQGEKGGSSLFLWLLILVLTGVAAKLVYDYFNAKPPAIATHEDAYVAPTASSSSVAITIDATPAVDAAAAPIDAALDAPSAEDADEGTNATADASTSDADVPDVRGITPLATDGGTHPAPRHDGGAHHPHHHIHHN